MKIGRKLSLEFASFYSSAPVREGFYKDEFGSKSVAAKSKITLCIHLHIITDWIRLNILL
jgi:hypothetical protein